MILIQWNSVLDSFNHPDKFSILVPEFQLSVMSSKFLKYGAPFLILIVGGSFALKEFAQLR